MSSFICGNTVSAPIHGPGSGAAIAEPTLCVGFACGKKPKNPPLIPRRGARPKGPAGPFGNPGASRGSPETVYVPHKATALCYNTVSFLPARLIRAPVLKPRPRSRAGRSAANVYLARFPRSVGRAFTPAAHYKILKNHRCGGAKAPPYNARQTPCRPGNGQYRNVRGRHICLPAGVFPARGSRENRPFPPLCRAGVHARRIL